MIVSIAWLYPGGYSAADWNVGLHGGAKNTVSAAENCGAGSIPSAAARSIRLVAAAARSVAVGMMVDESYIGLTATRNRVLDNRDMCRIISSFLPARNYPGGDIIY